MLINVFEIQDLHKCELKVNLPPNIQFKMREINVSAMYTPQKKNLSRKGTNLF